MLRSCLRRVGRIVRLRIPPPPHHGHHQVDADAEDDEPPSKPHLGATAGEKRGPISEYDLTAARLRRRRTRALPVEAPASSGNWKPTRKEEAALSDRNPNIRAAADSSISSRKPDHHYSGEPRVPKSSSSGHGAAADSKKSDHHGASSEPGAANSPGTGRGAAGEVVAGRDGVGSLASYTRIDVLGEGGFAVVWKARDTRTGEIVAVKSALERKGEKKGDGGAALLREAALLAACRGNPAVVGFRELVSGPGPQDLHIVMDFPGRSLRHLLYSRQRHFTEPETRDAMRQLLAGVESIGAQGIVHGDLKPDNVLVGMTDGRLIICDLGLAASTSEPPRHIEGTMYYAAPEQLLGENCGPPVDAWALGIIMVELLTGQPLFQGFHQAHQLTQTIFLLAVPDEVTLMHNEVDASMQSELRDTVPEDLLTQAGFDVLNGLLQFKPEDRLTPAAALQMPWFAEVEAPVSSVAPTAQPPSENE